MSVCIAVRLVFAAIVSWDTEAREKSCSDDNDLYNLCQEQAKLMQKLEQPYRNVKRNVKKINQLCRFGPAESDAQTYLGSCNKKHSWPKRKNCVIYFRAHRWTGADIVFSPIAIIIDFNWFDFERRTELNNCEWQAGESNSNERTVKCRRG